MRLLFIHQNLPGQYRYLLSHYGAQPGVDVVGLGEMKRLRENFRTPIAGVRLAGYQTPPAVSAQTPATLHTTEAAVQRGQAVLFALLRLKKDGFYPDVVYAHPGWGETLFLKDVFPRSRLVHFCEFYYQTDGQDFNFDREFPNTAEDVLRLRIRNLHHLMALEQADIGIAPTLWQKARFPLAYHPKIEVVHDGVDTSLVTPNPEAFVALPHKQVRLTSRDEVITFVNRNLEPYRGCHTFIRSLPQLLRRRPKAHVIVVGGDGVSYGRRLAEGTYRQKYLAEIADQFDPSRVHFVGKVNYKTFLRVLQVSTAHVYLTYPFVLSWSMMEAMSAGCLVIGSRTAPVEEVIEHGKNGLLVDFFSPTELCETIVHACSHRDSMMELRVAARRTIMSRYDLRSICLPRQRSIIEQGALGTSAYIHATSVTKSSIATAP